MLFGNSQRFQPDGRRSPGPGHYAVDAQSLHAQPFQAGYGRESYLTGLLKGDFLIFKPREVRARPQRLMGQPDLLNKPSFNVIASSETRKRLVNLRTVDLRM